jgi:hypothetical protein
MGKFSVMCLLGLSFINGSYGCEDQNEKRFLEGIIFRLAKFGDLPLHMDKSIDEFEYLAIIPTENTFVGYCRVALLPNQFIRLQQLSVADGYREKGIEGKLIRTAEKSLKRSLEK